MTAHKACLMMGANKWRTRGGWTFSILHYILL